jgi:hypothetical protein
VREYLLADPQREKDCLDRERKIDMKRRNDKVERLKMNEKQERINQQERNEERQRKNMEKSVTKGMKIIMKRSQKEKPHSMKKEKVVLTEE